MLADPLVLSLAPTTFRTYRRSRCEGDEGALALAAFSDTDQAMVTQLYVTLGELGDAIRAEDGSTHASRVAFRDRLGDLLGIGRMQLAGAYAQPLAEALHDIRGGAMTALLLGLGELPRAGRPGPADTALLALIRDQRKIIRNIVKDIDPAALERDRLAVPHSLADLSGGISSHARDGHGEDVAIEVHRAADAIVAASCLEFAALERAVFNLLNNAVRHVDGDVLDVWLLPLENDARIVVANPVTAAQASTLATKIEASPASLYGAFSTTGSGLGLSIVADIVGNAYGLSEADELVADGYIGTKVVDGAFVTWLHWPLSL